MGAFRVLILFGAAFWVVGGSVASAATNGANDYLQKLSPSARAAMLGRVVGESCSGRTAFYMGTIASGFGAGEAMWSVRCADDRAFAVQVMPDGSNQVLECNVLKALHAGSCFQRFNQ